MVQETPRKRSPKNASDKEKKMLQIRGDIQGLLYKEDWSAIDGMIRGVLYADRELAVSMIVWKNKWQQGEQTLLHDILCMPESEPPMSLLKIVVETAPQVLSMEDNTGSLPLHCAIYKKTAEEVKIRSFDICKFLIQADKERKTLSPVTFWQSVRRGEEQVIRHLLTFSQCAKALTIEVNGRIPLYYISKENQYDDKISSVLKLMIEATSDEMNKRPCCFYRSIENCADGMYDADSILEIARKEKLYCTNHLIDVARQRDTLASKREKEQAAKEKENGGKATSTNGRKAVGEKDSEPTTNGEAATASSDTS